MHYYFSPFGYHELKKVSFNQLTVFNFFVGKFCITVSQIDNISMDAFNHIKQLKIHSLTQYFYFVVRSIVRFTMLCMFRISAYNLYMSHQLASASFNTIFSPLGFVFSRLCLTPGIQLHQISSKKWFCTELYETDR